MVGEVGFEWLSSHIFHKIVQIVVFNLIGLGFFKSSISCTSSIFLKYGLTVESISGTIRH